MRKRTLRTIWMVPYLMAALHSGNFTPRPLRGYQTVDSSVPETTRKKADHMNGKPTERSMTYKINLQEVSN